MRSSFFFFFGIFALSPLWAGPLNPRFERSLATESDDIAHIVEGILYIQHQQALASGKILRGTHAKGVCAKGNLEIFDLDEHSKLKRGLFSVPGLYSSTLRFANADGKIADDQAPDVRALSLAVAVPQNLSNNEGRMDFAMNNADVFPINDAHVFGNLMILAKYGLLDGIWKIGLGALIGVNQAREIGNIQKQPARLAYQSMTYWSDVPFQLGEDQAVKYSLSPCQDNPAQALTNSPDTLSEELIRHLHQDRIMSCFDFKVQVLRASHMTDDKGRKHSPVDWVENATWEWKESQAPFVKVGQLTLLPNSDLDPASCEALKIDVTQYSNEIHRGLGSINRARSAGESASAKSR